MATHEIIIRREPVVGTEGSSPPPSSGVGVAKQQPESVAPQNNTAGMAKAAAAKVATQAIQSMASTYIANKTTEINVFTGSNQYAQRQAAINSMTSAGINIVSGTIQSGSVMAALGMSGGVAGMIGFAATLLGSLITTLSEIDQKRNELQIKHTAEQQELDYLRSRAGPFYNGSR